MHPLIVVFIAIFLIVVLTYKFKLHPFITLFIGALTAGILSGQAVVHIIDQLVLGFGNTLGQIGWIIAFGALLGVLLEKTKATQVIVEYLLHWFGLRRAGLAMNLTGFLIAIPVFCDAAFILLSGINKGLHKKTGLPKSFFATALATGLYAAHVFVPPTPGPLAAAAILEADLGYVIVGGLLIALPVALVGYLWAKRTHSGFDIVPEKKEMAKKANRREGYHVFLPIVVPVLLIALRTVSNYPDFIFQEGFLYALIQFFGHPILALCVGIGIAFLGAPSSIRTNKQLPNWINKALQEAGGIILVTGAGGAFGNVLKGLNIAELINPSSTTPLAALAFAFGIAALLKTAQGSSTVAILTTAALLAPITAAVGLADPLGKAFSVLAIGGGALTVSHVNDSYFWVVSQFSEIPPKLALQKYTTATAIQGFTALFLVLLAYSLLA